MGCLLRLGAQAQCTRRTCIQRIWPVWAIPPSRGAGSPAACLLDFLTGKAGCAWALRNRIYRPARQLSHLFIPSLSRIYIFYFNSPKPNLHRPLLRSNEVPRSPRPHSPRYGTYMHLSSRHWINLHRSDVQLTPAGLRCQAPGRHSRLCQRVLYRCWGSECQLSVAYDVIAETLTGTRVHARAPTLHASAPIRRRSVCRPSASLRAAV